MVEIIKVSTLQYDVPIANTDSIFALAYTTVTTEVVLRILVIDKVKGKARVPYLATEASWKECWQE